MPTTKNKNLKNKKVKKIKIRAAGRLTKPFKTKTVTVSKSNPLSCLPSSPAAWLGTVAVVLVVILAVLFICRGWVRKTVIPETTVLFYTHSIQMTMQDEYNKLDGPFSLLGYIKPVEPSANCALEFAQSIHTQINCGANWSGYTVLPKTAVGEAVLYENAHKLQRLFAQNGWSGPGNGMTVSKLVYDNTHGIDWDPDAYYQKTIGDLTCTFDTTEAYGSNQAPAENATLSCYRTLDAFGDPNLAKLNRPIFE